MSKCVSVFKYLIKKSLREFSSIKSVRACKCVHTNVPDEVQDTYKCTSALDQENVFI